MARYKGTVSSPHSAAEVWSYLADLRSAGQWDPSVDEVRLVSGTPRTVGAGYELAVSFLGGRVVLPYVTAAVNPPVGVVFTAETGSISVRDEATIRPDATGGSSVTWDAELRLKGVRRLLEPLLRVAFNRVGARAENGLRDLLGQAEVPQLREVTRV
jgi:hypothetical protein